MRRTQAGDKAAATPLKPCEGQCGKFVQGDKRMCFPCSQKKQFRDPPPQTIDRPPPPPPPPPPNRERVAACSKCGRDTVNVPGWLVDLVDWDCQDCTRAALDKRAG